MIRNIRIRILSTTATDSDVDAIVSAVTNALNGRLLVDADGVGSVAVAIARRMPMAKIPNFLHAVAYDCNGMKDDDASMVVAATVASLGFLAH